MVTEKVNAQSGHNWMGKQYTIEGSWQIETVNGDLQLKFGDDFKTLRGPDVKVYLSPKDINDIGNREPVDKEGVYLGLIESFMGEQVFIIPTGINLKDYKSIVLHCQAYSVVWGGTNYR